MREVHPSPNIFRKCPEWAEGCENCIYGKINERLPGILPMYIEEALLFDAGFFNVCDCRAGHMTRQRIRKRLNRLALGKQAGGEYLDPRQAEDCIAAAEILYAPPSVHAEESA